MQCPVCGHDEERGTSCSQCHTPFPEGQPIATPPAPNAKKAAHQQPAGGKQGKHRSRPLHDLDLTIPELEVKSGSTPPPLPAQGKPTAPESEEPDFHRPVDFSSFILSLAASAVMSMGGAPATGQPAASPADLAQAKDVIDLLEILELKTRGNLSAEEGKLLSQTRASLQKRFNQLLRK